LLAVLLTACEEEIAPTPAQVTAQKLVSNLHISLDATTTEYGVTVAELETNATLFVGVTLKITSDGFAEVGNGGAGSATFNLQFLKSFQLSGGQLRLYF